LARSTLRTTRPQLADFSPKPLIFVIQTLILENEIRVFCVSRVKALLEILLIPLSNSVPSNHALQKSGNGIRHGKSIKAG